MDPQEQDELPKFISDQPLDHKLFEMAQEDVIKKLHQQTQGHSGISTCGGSEVSDREHSGNPMTIPEAIIFQSQQ